MSPLPDRRSFLATCAAIGASSTLFPGVLWAKIATGTEITPQVIADAEQLAGVEFNAAQRDMLVDTLKGQSAQVEVMQKVHLDNSVAPSFNFDPVPPGRTIRQGPRKAPVRSRSKTMALPSDLDKLAFEPITVLSELVRTRKVTPTQLTRMYLARLKKYDPQLKCVITLTEERALKQAAAADVEIANGKYLGALHGIPWGAKDLPASK